MQQTEQIYLHTLRARLTGYVSREDLDDILADYAEHFSIGKSEGRSEEDLWKALGSPEDVAKEIRATYLVTKAEQARSARNIWHAVMATLGLGLFNLVFVLIPFLVIIVLLAVIFIVGMLLLILGPFLLLVAVMHLLGASVTIPWWPAPQPGIIVSFALFIAGAFMVIVDLHLAKVFYRLAIRYLKWNIHVIRGGEAPGPREPVEKTTLISRDGATGLDLQMLFGAGEILLGEGTDEQTLVKLTSGSDAFPAPLDYSASLFSTVKKVRIRGRHSLGTWCSHDSSCAWDIRLNRDVPVSLDLRNKAGRTRLELGELDLSSLRIRNGVGSLIIRMPKESNMRIQIHRGIGDMDVRGFIVEGDTYLTHAQHPDAPQITCQIKQGIGSISLEAV